MFPWFAKIIKLNSFYWKVAKPENVCAFTLVMWLSSSVFWYPII